MAIGTICALPLVAAAILLLAGHQSPPEFEVISLKIVPPEVTAGETATIRAEVANHGGSEGRYDAVLAIDRAEVETKSLSLAPGATETVTFSLVKDETGYYEIAIGNRSITLAVQEASPPAFHISGLVINPAEIDPGKETTITAKVTNSGGTDGSYTAELKINETLEQATEVSVAAGANRTLTFLVSRDLPGTYTVTLGQLTGQFMVSWPVNLIPPIVPKPTAAPSCSGPGCRK